MILKESIDPYKYSNFLPRILIALTSLFIFFLVANNIIINLNSEIISIIIKSISDAYLQVSVFVAAVLLVFYGVENIFGIDLTKKLQNGGRKFLNGDQSTLLILLIVIKLLNHNMLFKDCMNLQKIKILILLLK